MYMYVCMYVCIVCMWNRRQFERYAQETLPSVGYFGRAPPLPQVLCFPLLAWKIQKFRRLFPKANVLHFTVLDGEM